MLKHWTREDTTGSVKQIVPGRCDSKTRPLESYSVRLCLGRICQSQGQLLSKISKLPMAGRILMLLVLRTEVLQMALPKYFKRDRQIKLTDFWSWEMQIIHILGLEMTKLFHSEHRGEKSEVQERNLLSGAGHSCADRRSSYRGAPFAYSITHQNFTSCWASLPMAKAGKELLCAG